MMISCHSGNDSALFCSEQLQSVVEQYIDEIGIIKNPEGKPTIILLDFLNTYPEYENDTLLILRPSLESYSAMSEIWNTSECDYENGPFGMNGTLIGASYIGSTICEIVYDGFHSLSNLVNEEAFPLRPEDYMQALCDVNESALHEWFRHEYVKYNKIKIYRLVDNGNTLELIESR